MVQYLITFYVILPVNLIVMEQNLIICELLGHGPLEMAENFKKNERKSFYDKLPRLKKGKLEISKIIKNALKLSPSRKTLSYYFLEAET